MFSKRIIRQLRTTTVLACCLSLFAGFALPAISFAGTTCGTNPAVKTSIDIGCTGKIKDPILDATFGIIRFLSDGVGLVVIASVIYGGIQRPSSRGDPQSTAQAIGRIRSSLIALLLFIFGYAILNYLIPTGFLK